MNNLKEYDFRKNTRLIIDGTERDSKEELYYIVQLYDGFSIIGTVNSGSFLV